MRAKKTVYIGGAVFLLSVIQFLAGFDPVRIPGMAIGLFLVLFGWKIGWTRYRNFTVLLGHFAITAGCLVTAYGVYQLPFFKSPPTILETLDLPLFWGLFTIFGGYCMITHSYCACAARMHEANQAKRKN